MRPEWDEWFMTLCFVIAQRSLDPDTKHGCVVVKEKTILSVGYNSPPRGCDDASIPLTRPEKYKFMEHAESNAINNAARTGMALNGSTFYVTGHPCQDCLRRVINVGASCVIYGSVGSHCIKEEDKVVMNVMLQSSGVQVALHSFVDISGVYNLLGTTRNYISKKGFEI